MIRRLLVTIGATLSLMGSVVIIGAGTAAAYGPAKAAGIANCHIAAGSGTLTPGLTPTGTKGKVKISFTASLTDPCPNASVTSPSGVTILGGTVTGAGVYAPPVSGDASACPNFDGPDILRHLAVTVAWTTSGPAIAKTRVAFRGGTGTVSGSPTDAITLDTPPVPVVVKAGSFAAPSTTHTVQLDTTIPGPGCGPGPYTTFTITGGVVTV
jgi:hypothetical protein